MSEVSRWHQVRSTDNWVETLNRICLPPTPHPQNPWTVSSMGLRYHPLPAPQYPAQSLTQRNAWPRCVKWLRKEQLACWWGTVPTQAALLALILARTAQSKVRGHMGTGSLMVCGLNKPKETGCCRELRLLFLKERGQAISSRVEPKTETINISHRETAKTHLVHANCCTNEFRIICWFREIMTFVLMQLLPFSARIWHKEQLKIPRVTFSL